MKVTVKEPQQYRSTYQSLIFHDVVKTTESKDGKYIYLWFEDGYKSRRLKSLVVSIDGKPLAPSK